MTSSMSVPQTKQSTMPPTQDDLKSRKVFYQLRRSILRSERSDRSNKRIVSVILEEDFNVNYKVARERLSDFDSDPGCYSPPVKHCTVLHVLASEAYDIDIFKSLLERGADFTVKNEFGQTALHMLVKYNDRRKHHENDATPFVDSILSAHVKFQNSTNPRDNNGFSHLHVACITNHVEAVTFFLDNGASVDEAVNLESPIYPGYTPLHLAAHFASFETVEILLSRGANINAKDARGMSFVDVLVERRLRKSSRLKDPFSTEDDNIWKAFDNEFSDNEKIIKLLLDKQLLQRPSNFGLSALQVASTLKDLNIAKSLLDQDDDINYAVPKESSIWAGYTAVHFAALNRVGAVKMLATRGAKLDVEDANGFTPFDICARNGYSVRDIHDILLCVEDFREICLTDGKTKLLDLVLSMRDVNQFLDKNAKDLVVPSDSPLWPGSSILHLAVILSRSRCQRPYSYDNSIVDECLKRGLDVNARNGKGQTCLHLAFRSAKINTVELLISHLSKHHQFVNHLDEDNLSHLHIACTTYDHNFVEKLLGNSSEPNVAYKGERVLQMRVETGWTPLHVVVAWRSHQNAEALLRHGADLHAADIHGLTPIHWLLKGYITDSIVPQIDCVLFEALLKNPHDRVVENLGLGYLHVACVYGRTEAAKKLIDLGSSINAVVNFDKASHYFDRLLPDKELSFLAKYATFTPLHCATLDPCPDMIDLLLRRGADVFAKFSKLPDSCILLEKIDIVRRFVPMLWENDEMQKCMETRFGITRLHVACFMRNKKAIKSASRKGVDVNAKIHTDSVIFAGCTPLHMLMTISESKSDSRRSTFTVNGMIDSLLDRGADVTITNAEGNSPIHVFCKFFDNFDDNNLCKDSLIKAHRDFSVNPANKNVTSHFHLACLWQQVDVVKNFLQYGSVDVNRPINSGSTPLHLTLSHELYKDDSTKRLNKRSQIVDLLLKNGANVNAIDDRGDTPLHKCDVSNAVGIGILEKLVSHGADLRSENVYGERPIESWSCVKLDDITRICQKVGFQMNCMNRFTGQGIIAKIFLSRYGDISQDSTFNKWLQSSDARSLDEMGRTAMQNAVANLCHDEGKFDNYVYAIESFMKLGIDIDHRDKAGKTALHYAAQTNNRLGLKALLKCGADMNIVDNSGKPAYFYAMEDVTNKYVDRKSVIGILHEHVQKLQYLGLEISKHNRDLSKDAQQRWGDKYTGLSNELSEAFQNQVEMTKTLTIASTSLTLFDFLCETRAVTLYPFLSEETQREIDDFIKSIDLKQLVGVDGIIKLQYRKIKARSEMFESALCSLRILLGFSFPGLCEKITRFLTNADLKNLIESTGVGDEKNESLDK